MVPLLASGLDFALAGHDKARPAPALPRSQGEAQRPGADQATSRPAADVGGAACAACHERAQTAWTGSQHAHVIAVADNAGVQQLLIREAGGPGKLAGRIVSQPLPIGGPSRPLAPAASNPRKAPFMITRRHLSTLALATLALVSAPAWADEYQDTIDNFRKAEESGKFFASSVGYAVFPTIGKGGVGIGGAYGKGKVYRAGKVIGDVSMTQLSFGAQLGGEGFSQIIFFENEAAVKKFTQGEFEFGVEAQAVVITLAAGAQGGTAGGTAGASGRKDKAKVVGTYNNGMAIFTVIKGGLMYEISAAGQKFKFTPR
jgi:hypothetical protein